jgi:serine/threonine-protein kinase
MQVGEQLGPFAIDKELGSGAMGSVYRGIYTKTGQRVAIKIMAPGLAASESSLRRFEREATILKQLKHPNIVRLFGIGKHHGARYYAMEYIEGESLDHTLARRVRFTWEEVVAFGKQLCAALQHAHEHGIVHRDLKPSNLMILKDGTTLKLTDFGIAKDTDATQLTSANCTVGTASYMSPEQCRGERDLTAKSDLYSLGIVFYELLTGRKPFNTENAMEMFLMHVNEKPPRVAAFDVNIPARFDSLIDQLLEKKPEQRPLDAGMVLRVFEEIQEQFEQQKSAAVVAAGRKLLDATPEQRKIDDEDREAVRALLGKKPKKKKRPAFFRTIWFQILGIAALLTVMGLLFWIAFRPPAPEKLYDQAKKLMASNDPEQWDKATADQGPVALYLKHHGDRPGDETKQMREWQKLAAMSWNDRLVTKYINTLRNKSALKVQAQNETEEAAFKAARAEEEGDLAAAKKQWDEIKQKAIGGWAALAEKRSALATRALDQDTQWQKLFDDIEKRGIEPKLSDKEQEEQQAFLAHRAEHFGDLGRAGSEFVKLKDRCEAELKEKYHDWTSETRYWHLYAVMKAKELKDKPATDVVKLLTEKLDMAQKPENKAIAPGIYRHITALYDKDKDDKVQAKVKVAADALKQLAPTP